MDLEPARILCIGTHHKTGTLWMRGVFKGLAKALDIPMQTVFPRQPAPQVAKGERAILVNWTSRFNPALLARGDVRILHMIRDPRDVLLSGARYHCVAPVAGEEFLHKPRADLGGQTYQTHLNALSDDDKLRFEMREKHAQTLREMMDWDYTAPNRVELRYEDMMADTEGAEFANALARLDLALAEIETGRRIFINRSLFGRLSDPDTRPDRLNLHIADGRVAQWRRKLPRAVAEEYAETHGEALVALGYETHPTAWLDRLEDAQ